MSTPPTSRIGGSKKIGTDEILFSGGGCLPVHRIKEPASSFAYRPSDDLLLMIRIEEGCLYPIEEGKRIDEGPSVITFTQWINDVKRHFLHHGLDSCAYILKPKENGASLPDINNIVDVERECNEYNIFDEWYVLTKEDLDAWDIALQTSKCPMDKTNNTCARNFLRSSIGPVLKERIDRQLPIDVSGPQMLFFIISRLQFMAAAPARQLVKELQAIKLTSGAATRQFQDDAQKIRNICARLDGFGPRHVPSDLPMLVVSCFDNTGVYAVDLQVATIENDLHNDPSAHHWTSILHRLTTKVELGVRTNSVHE